MKQLIKLILPIIVLVVSALQSCHKSKTDPATSSGEASVSFAIDGDGYAEQNITIKSNPGSKENVSAYFTKWDFTGGHIADQGSSTGIPKNKFTFYVDEKKTGAQTLGTELQNDAGPFQTVTIQLDLTAKDGTEKSYVYGDQTFFGDPVPPGGTITITNYGAVNGYVEGDFQGHLFNTDNQKIVTIKNGHFKIPRSQDVN